MTHETRRGPGTWAFGGRILQHKEGLPRSLVRSFDLDGASNGAEGETDREGGEERRGEGRMGREGERGREASTSRPRRGGGGGGGAIDLDLQNPSATGVRKFDFVPMPENDEVPHLQMTTSLGKPTSDNLSALFLFQPRVQLIHDIARYFFLLLHKHSARPSVAGAYHHLHTS